MKKTVLVGLDKSIVYHELIEYLNNMESEDELEISQNIDSQATFLYFLPKIRPDAVVVSENLAGELSFEDFQVRIKQALPETELLVHSGGDAALVGDSLLPKHSLLNKIIAVWSPCGGVGKTEIAKNLALAAGSSHRVILVDANLCNPDIGQHLGLHFKRGQTLSAALELWSEKRSLSGSLRKALMPYRNIRVLIGCEDAIEQSDYSPMFFRDLLRTLAQQADFVVVDMDSEITSPAGLSVLLASNHIVVPFNTAASTLVNSKVYLDLLSQSYQINRAKFDPVLNRAGEGGTVSEQDIEICLRRPVIGSIPYDKGLLRSACEGKPLLIEKGRTATRLASTFLNLTDQYAKKDVVSV